jgi:hypothetical protein
MAGVAFRVSAVAGAIMLAMMGLAEFPPALVTATGELSGSTNPLVDYLVIYALALVVVAAAQAGRTWGVGGAWRRIPFVRAHPWALGKHPERTVPRPASGDRRFTSRFRVARSRRGSARRAGRRD